MTFFSSNPSNDPFIVLRRYPRPSYTRIALFRLLTLLLATSLTHQNQLKNLRFEFHTSKFLLSLTIPMLTVLEPSKAIFLELRTLSVAATFLVRANIKDLKGKIRSKVKDLGVRIENVEMNIKKMPKTMGEVFESKLKKVLGDLKGGQSGRGVGKGEWGGEFGKGDWQAFRLE